MSARPWQRALPNRLTTARLVLAAGFVALLAPYRHLDPSPRGEAWIPLTAAALFLIAAATDALDGYLARRWNVVSVYGRVVDPLADKILVLGAFVLLAGPGFAHPADGALRHASGVAPWMTVVILTRELVVTSLRGLVESKGGDFSATFSGKLKMMIQSGAAPAILALVGAEAAGVADALPWTAWIAWAVTAVTAWSAVPYIARAVRFLGKESA